MGAESETKLFLYRALEIGEIKLKTASYTTDILSEHYSRVLKTSKNVSPTLRCASEDPRVALQYSRMPGYSGDIAKIGITIMSDGTCKIDQMPKATVHRLWRVIDWLDLASTAGVRTARNNNYETEPVTLESIIGYGGHQTARAFSHAKRTWAMHSSDIAYAYDMIEENEKKDISNITYFRLPSYNAILYDNPGIKNLCTSLITSYERMESDKAWVRNTIDELKRIAATLR